MDFKGKTKSFASRSEDFRPIIARATKATTADNGVNHDKAEILGGLIILWALGKIFRIGTIVKYISS